MLSNEQGVSISRRTHIHTYLYVLKHFLWVRLLSRYLDFEVIDFKYQNYFGNLDSKPKEWSMDFWIYPKLPISRRKILRKFTASQIYLGKFYSEKSYQSHVLKLRNDYLCIFIKKLRNKNKEQLHMYVFKIQKVLTIQNFQAFSL